jgi:hypothetical protein
MPSSAAIRLSSAPRSASVCRSSASSASSVSSWTWRPVGKVFAVLIPATTLEQTRCSIKFFMNPAPLPRLERMAPKARACSYARSKSGVVRSASSWKMALKLCGSVTKPASGWTLTAILSSNPRSSSVARAQNHVANEGVFPLEERCAKVFELGLDPGNTLRGIILPQDLVVTLPTVTRFVHGPDEAELAPVGPLDDAGLAVDETADAIRRNPDDLTTPGVEGVQTLVALPVPQGLRLDGPLVPAPQHAGFAQLGNLQILRYQVDVADDPNIRYRLQPLVGDLEQRVGEVTGDAPVTPCSLELFGQKALVQTLSARGEAADGHGSLTKTRRHGERET